MDSVDSVDNSEVTHSLHKIPPAPTTSVLSLEQDSGLVIEPEHGF